MAPTNVLKTLAYWYKEGIKDREFILSLVPSKITQEEANAILGEST